MNYIELEETRQYFQSLSMPKRLEFIEAMTPASYRYFKYFTDVMYSDKQIIPEGDWKYYLLLGGRGSGKTNALCHDIQKRLMRGDPGLMLVVASADDQDDIAQDLLAQFPEDYPAKYTASTNSFLAPNGNELIFKTAGKGIIKGKNTTTCYIDELSECWRTSDFDKQLEYFAILDGNIRRGNAQMIMTANPETTPIFRHLWDMHLTNPKDVVIVPSSIYENPYLEPKKRQIYINQWKGTRYEKMQLLGILDWSVDGALWTQKLIDETRCGSPIPGAILHDHISQIANPNPKQQFYLRNPMAFFYRILIAVDPAMSVSEKSDETGIIIAALGMDNHVYILEDLSGKWSPDEMAEIVQQALTKYPSAQVAIETNQGGMYVIDALKTKIPYIQAPPSGGSNHLIIDVKVHQSKMTRAQHVVILWDQKTAHIVGSMPKLEQQMIYYTGDSKQKSPDRFDAMVMAVQELSFNQQNVSPGTSSLPRMM